MAVQNKKQLMVIQLGSAALFLVFAVLLFTRSLPLDMNADMGGFHQQDVLAVACIGVAIFDLVVLNVLLRR